MVTFAEPERFPLMFNFLVSHVGWKPPSGSIGLDRLLEFTAPTVEQRFRSEGQVDLDAVAKLPTLFMTEIGGSGPQEARVGRISRVVLQGRNVEFEFHFDANVPPLSVATVEALANELHVADDKWELRRVHWAVKSVDLFGVLYRHALKDTPRPRIHGVDSVLPIDPNQVSVMIRFRADFHQVFDVIKEAAQAEGFECERVMDIWQRDAIITDIANLIMRSRVVVADLTDRNANVFYECGLAHGVGREVIPITQDKADNFDLQHLRHIEYQNTRDGREVLGQKLLARFKAIRGEPK